MYIVVSIKDYDNADAVAKFLKDLYDRAKDNEDMIDAMRKVNEKYEQGSLEKMTRMLEVWMEERLKVNPESQSKAFRDRAQGTSPTRPLHPGQNDNYGRLIYKI